MAKLHSSLFYTSLTVGLLANIVFAQDVYNPSITIEAHQPTKSIAVNHPTAQLCKVIAVDFENQKLEEVLDFISKSTSIDMYIDWVGLENVGVEKNLPITLKMNNVSADAVLDMVLELASTNNKLDPIWHDENDRMINVASKRKLLQEHQQIIVYDVNDLIDRNSEENKDVFKITDCTIQFKSDTITKMMELISRQSAPEEYWVKWGGDYAAITEFNGKFIVIAHRSIQQKVSKLLAEFRNQSAQKSSIQPLAIRHHIKALGQLLSIDMKEIKLKEALAHIGKSIDVPIIVDWQTLVQIGIEPNSPVTLAINNIKAGDVLDLILKQASDDKPEPLWHDETPRAIEISTRRQLLKTNQYLVTYDIRDLVPQINYDSKQTITSSTEFRSQRVEELQALIRNTFSTRDWLEYGGDISSIRKLDAAFVVSAHRSMHQNIDQFLTALRHQPPKEQAGK